MDETLDAEQSAARAAARRRRTLRDLFLDAEDRSERTVVFTSDGRAYRGTVTAVGMDHVEVAGSEGTWLIILAQVAAVGRSR
jgi:hypothetical protein